MEDLLAIAFRISILYLYVLAVFRLSGKRSISSLSPLDFVVANLVSDLFDDVIWAEVPLSQGIVAFTVVIVLHMGMALFQSRSSRFHRLVSGMKTVVVENGRFREAGLAEERTRESEVRFEIRLQKTEELEEVREAAWEQEGQISVLKEEHAKPAQKSDYQKLKEALRP